MQQSSATQSLHLCFWGLRKIVACSHSSSQCLLVSTVFGTVSSLHPTSFLMIFILIYNYTVHASYLYVYSCTEAVKECVHKCIMKICVYKHHHHLYHKVIIIFEGVCIHAYVYILVCLMYKSSTQTLCLRLLFYHRVCFLVETLQIGGTASVFPTSYFIFNDFYTYIRESVDSLCRDGADTPMPPYIGKAFTRTNLED